MTTHCLEVHASPPEVYRVIVDATARLFALSPPPSSALITCTSNPPTFTPKPPLNNKPPQPLPVRLVLSSAATRLVVHYLTGDTPFRARISLRYVCTRLILCAPRPPNSSYLFALSSSSPHPIVVARPRLRLGKHLHRCDRPARLSIRWKTLLHGRLDTPDTLATGLDSSQVRRVCDPTTGSRAGGSLISSRVRPLSRHPRMKSRVSVSSAVCAIRPKPSFRRTTIVWPRQAGSFGRSSVISPSCLDLLTSP